MLLRFLESDLLEVEAGQPRLLQQLVEREPAQRGPTEAAQTSETPTVGMWLQPFDENMVYDFSSMYDACKN